MVACTGLPSQRKPFLIEPVDLLYLWLLLDIHPSRHPVLISLYDSPLYTYIYVFRYAHLSYYRLGLIFYSFGLSYMILFCAFYRYMDMNIHYIYVLYGYTYMFITTYRHSYIFILAGFIFLRSVHYIRFAAISFPF